MSEQIKKADQLLKEIIKSAELGNPVQLQDLITLSDYILSESIRQLNENVVKKRFY